MKKQSDLKQILLTFDYELFMGSRSGTVENCLLKPTNEILGVLLKNGGRAVFFVDATFLNKLRQDSTEDFFLVKEQIKRMCKEGHLVELHIHPQWLEAYKISDNEWAFKKEMKYRLDLFDVQEMQALFQDSYDLLQAIVQEAGAQYKVSAFRAGGWSLPAFSLLKPLFQKLGMKYDLSVLPGSRVDNGIFQKYDYTSVPSNKAYWSFAEDVRKSESGDFVEVPCTMVKFNRLDLIKNRIEMKKQKAYGDGVGAVYKKGGLTKLEYVFTNPHKPLTLDGYGEALLLKSIRRAKLGLVTLVGHPKSFGPSNIEALDNITMQYPTVLLQDLKV